MDVSGNLPDVPVNEIVISHGQLVDAHRAISYSPEVVVVADDRDTVRARVDIGLQVHNADRDGLRECEESILRRLERETAVGDDPRGRRWKVPAAGPGWRLGSPGATAGGSKASWHPWRP